MKTKYLIVTVALLTTIIAAKGQGESRPLFNEFKLEARGDFGIDATNGNDANYGFVGRYFNLHLGGDLGEKFNYYVRQRIIARPGTVSLFDNTDFLYINYNVNKNIRLRGGKDAMAVGGYEYDARPIDVYYNTIYWDNFYCFQLGLSAAYTTDDGSQSIIAQVTNSPAVHYGGPAWNSGLLAYNLMWIGKLGPLQTMWSANMFQREDKSFMNYIALGNRLEFDRWAVYLDFIHHALDASDWGRNYCLVSRVDFNLGRGWNLFVKGAYEKNQSDVDLNSIASLDMFVPAGMTYALYGAGVEYRPERYSDVRLHAYLASRHSTTIGGKEDDELMAALGVTWDMNFLNLLKRK